MKRITPDLSIGLGLSNLHIEDDKQSYRGLSTEDDLGS